MLPERKMKTFRAIQNLITPERGYINYRQHLRSACPPCIPYLGLLLTDLTFINEGCHEFLPGTDLIYWSKRKKTFQVIQDMQQYQQSPYIVAEVALIQEYFDKNVLGKDCIGQLDEAYSLSRAYEPPGSSPPYAQTDVPPPKFNLDVLKYM